jgi:signal transduction histidine kinase
MTRPRKQFPGEVTLGMAHEIGNMLGALQLRLQILQQNPACRKAQGRNLDAMARILDEANDLVQRVQALGMATPLPRSTSGEPALVNVQRTVAEAIQLAGNGLRLRARRAGVQLRIEQALGRLPDVPGAPSDIRRLMVRLLIGAGKSFPKGGTMRVVGRKSDAAVILRIVPARGTQLARGRGQASLPLELRLPRAAPKPRRSRSAASQHRGD